MARLNLPEPFAGIDDIVEQGDMASARSALAKAQGNAALVELLEVKIGLYEDSLAPQLAMNRLLVLMRQDANLPGAHALYQEASTRSYEGGESSLSHSHPPPPSQPKPGPQK
ncbi:MAG TPA: hypothetical protein VHU80_17000 [Polyangiaceae bacterium]|jgi:hypothetical protein|nr:hypothetical protein [Polyangiaceae bacterium]